MTLKVGSIAPLFNSVDQNGDEINLEKLRGKKVILYFYPKDDTPGCTAEACSLRDGFSILQRNGYVIIGVSPDNSVKHLKFIDKYNLPFPLIPDSDKSILKAYEVWGPKKFMGRTYDGVIRTTFVIDENGIIIKIITKVDTKNHFDQLVNELEIEK